MKFLVFCCVAVLTVGGCDRLPWGASERPNIVLLLVDALRADRLSGYRYARQTSPELDALAARGVRFEQCYTQAQYTSASTASVFTGRYPLSHGYVNATYVLEEDNQTLAELLRDRGYATAAFVANSAVGRKYRMDQGFDRFVELFSEEDASPAPAVLDSVYAFLETRRRRPFFVYVHFMDVHNPYDTPAAVVRSFADPDTFAFDMGDDLLRERMTVEAFRGLSLGPIRPEPRRYFRTYSDLYDASIRDVDEQIGRFIEVLRERGLDGHTLLVVTADHGEQILDHGYFGHGNTVYDEVLRVPLILYDPARPELAGLTVADPVRLIDLPPTLLDRCSVAVPPEVEGTSLWPLLEARLKGEGGFVHTQGVYIEGTWFANRPFSTLMQTYREGDWKLLLDRLRDRKELYNVREDPGEQQDRIEAEPAVAQRLYEALRTQYNRNLDLFQGRRMSKLEHEEEKLRELAALGYVNVPVRRSEHWQYFPMKAIRIEPFGPFGDEEDLAGFSDQIDLTRAESIAWGQVVQGCFAGRGPDSSGLWFDQRATFLMPVRSDRKRVAFDIWLDPQRGTDNPTEIQVTFNDLPVQTFALDGPGRHVIQGMIPDAVRASGYFYVGVDANRSFVLLSGGSPGKEIHGAMKIRSVRLER